MNTPFNAYPQGRWSTPKPTSPRRETMPGCRLVPSQPIEATAVPLSQLFWGAHGLALNEDARQRIDRAITAVLAREVAREHALAEAVSA